MIKQNMNAVKKPPINNDSLPVIVPKAVESAAAIMEFINTIEIPNSKARPMCLNLVFIACKSRCG